MVVNVIRPSPIGNIDNRGRLSVPPTLQAHTTFTYRFVLNRHSAALCEIDVKANMTDGNELRQCLMALGGEALRRLLNSDCKEAK
jgi:hypothetical protein